MSEVRKWLALSARMDPEDLREFRNNPDDNFMVALFADHWLQ
jgi:hypothetical protein